MDLYWIKNLKQALLEDRIFCYYQPIVNNSNYKIEHYEVLCRLRESNGKIINASYFIKAAQEVGLVTKITKVILDEAFKNFSKTNYNFSINICHYDLYEDYLLEYIQHKCKMYYVDPSRVYLELIGETHLVHSDALIEQITKLQKFGIHIGIDDINMEYSLFSRMLHLNADYIKIDKHFTHNIAQNSSNQEMVGLIVEFAKKSNMKTIAEHVETQEEFEVITQLGVDYSQGYFIGKPNDSTSIKKAKIE